MLNKDNKNIFFLLFVIMYCTKSSHNSDLSNINYNNCINIQHELFLRVYRRRCSRLYSKIRYIHPTSLRSSSKQKPYIYWTVKENESKHLNTIVFDNNVHNTKQNKKCSAIILLRIWTLPLFLDYFKYLCHCNIIYITAEHTKVMLGTNFTSYGLITYGGTWFKLPYFLTLLFFYR